MDEFDKNFIKNMSPLLITAVVMFFLMVAYETKAEEDKIMGYTHDGIPVLESELEISTFNFERVRSWDWNEETETLRLTFRQNKKIDITFFNRCWDMKYASALQFNSWARTRHIGKGDSIMPIGWTSRRGLYPCTIKKMVAVVPEEKDGEEN
jgi:hypothetical protein